MLPAEELVRRSTLDLRKKIWITTVSVGLLLGLCGVFASVQAEWISESIRDGPRWLLPLVGVVLGTVVGLFGWIAVLVVALLLPKNEVYPKLTDKSLGQLLRQMGYQVTTMPITDGFVHNVTINAGNVSGSFDVVFSQQHEYICLMGWLSDIPAPAERCGTQLFALLEASARYAPNTFGYSQHNKCLVAQRYIENLEVTPQRLLNAIQDLLGVLQATHTQWNTECWGQLGGGTSSPIGKPIPHPTPHNMKRESPQ